MKLNILWFSLFCSVVATAQASGNGGREIGYIESFDKASDRFSIHRGDKTLPVEVMTPIVSGDRIEVKDVDARIVVRLVGHSQPVVISKSNLDVPLVAEDSSKTYWTPIMAWAAQQLQIFDHEERQSVPASIRGNGTAFSVPMLATGQVLQAGPQSLAIAWKGGGEAAVSLKDESGETVLAGAGLDGAWQSSPSTIHPGVYQLEVIHHGLRVRQVVEFVPQAEMPSIQTEAERHGLPVELQDLVLSLQLASSDPRYVLAAYQRAVSSSSADPLARLVRSRLAQGERPSPSN